MAVNDSVESQCRPGPGAVGGGGGDPRGELEPFEVARTRCAQGQSDCHYLSKNND
jgi:hypothetical protein